MSEAKTLARQAGQPYVHDSDSEVELVPPLLKTASGTQLPAGAYQCCGKQLPAMSSLESEHITLDAVDQCDQRQQKSAQAIGDSDTVGNEAPALGSAHCFQPGDVVSYLLNPEKDEHHLCLVKVVDNHTLSGSQWHTVQDVNEQGPPFAVHAGNLKKPDNLPPENDTTSSAATPAKGQAKDKGTQGPKHKGRVKGTQSQKTGVPGAPSTGTAPALGSAQETTEGDESNFWSDLRSDLTGVLKYKTANSAGSSAYKKYVREHPGDLDGARKACKAASAEYRRFERSNVALMHTNWQSDTLSSKIACMP